MCIHAAQRGYLLRETIGSWESCFTHYSDHYVYSCDDSRLCRRHGITNYDSQSHTDVKKAI